MKKDIPLKWYFRGTKAERKKKKDLHSNDSIFALKLHGIFRAPNNRQIRNSNHTLGRLGFLLLKRKTVNLWGQLPRQQKSKKSWLLSNHWIICPVDPHPPTTLLKIPWLRSMSFSGYCFYRKLLMSFASYFTKQRKSQVWFLASHLEGCT